MSPTFWGSVDGWIAIAGLGVGTFLIRYSFIGLLAGRRLPPRVERALQLAVPAIFAAIVIPLIIFAAGRVDFSTRWPHIVAAIFTGVYAWWRGGMLTPIVIGMATLYAIDFLGKQ
jgi:branched-subunit amino acid transport protein